MISERHPIAIGIKALCHQAENVDIAKPKPGPRERCTCRPLDDSCVANAAKGRGRKREHLEGRSRFRTAELVARVKSGFAHETENRSLRGLKGYYVFALGHELREGTPKVSRTTLQFRGGFVRIVPC
jgi:hypothetical protein